MKILVICQYYSPEPFRHPDFCEELALRGNEVTVITGVPNYPMGDIYLDYRHGKNRDEMINGVKVHRCFTIGRKAGTIRRFLNYYSYAISSTRFVRKIKDEYDIVLVNQLSPIMMASAGIVYKTKHQKKMILYCLDLWPESLCTGGIRRGGLIYKYFHNISKKVYNRADKILVTSSSFAEYFEKEFNITDVEYLPQYAESIFKYELCKKEPNNFVDLMFAGNLGIAQSVNTIIEAVRLTKDLTNLRVHIVGDGSEYESLKKQAKDLDNVIFYGRKPIEEMPKYYALADAMIITMQDNPILSLTLPGKIQTYMAVGKPIIGAIDGAARSVLEEANCGFCGKAENAIELAQNIRRFVCDQENRMQYGENAYRYYKNNFTKEIFIQHLEKVIKNEGDNKNEAL